MTLNDQIRETVAMNPDKSPAWIVAAIERFFGVRITAKQVSNALRSRSSRPGPARSPASCPTCGARPCHQRGGVL